MSTRSRFGLRRRSVAAFVAGTVAPLMVAAGIAGMGHRAEAAGISAHPARQALAVNNPVQCLLEDMQCAKDAATGQNPCDPIPC